MSYKSNAWLEKFEYKKPDYNYINREFLGDYGEYTPARYVLTDGVWKQEKKSASESAKLMFVGDITCFEKQFEQAEQGECYDFNYEFDKVRPIFKQADLVVGNLETMIFTEAPYRTEKYVSEQNFHCNAPVEFLTAVRNSGIDVLTNANNHDLDTGAVGIGETIDHINNLGFIHTGTFKSDKKHYEIIEVNGFKIAIVAFATNHNNKEENLTEEGREFLLNDYSKKKAKEIITQARNDGAELVFVCIHWGNENKLIQSKKQTAIAKEMAVMGYDCIIGSHPHVLQPFDFIETKEKKVPVFFSMGNFISHNTNNQKSRTVIACVDIKRSGEKVTLECSYIPAFTSKNFGEKKYIVLPLKAGLLDIKNRRKMEHIKKVIGSKISLNKDIKFKKCVEGKDLPEERRRIEALKPETITTFPVTYDDGDFTYTVFEENAVITGISPASLANSYSTPEEISGISVTGIEMSSFEDNQIMKKINFRKNIKAIPERMCKNCSTIEGFQLSNYTSVICDEAFYGCEKLSAVVIRKGINKIGSKAFGNCNSLQSVKIISQAIEIADDAFAGCDSLVFYCEKDSCGDEYARSHGFKVVHMNF